MPVVMTIEIEHADGDEIEIDQVAAVLRGLNIKVKAYAPGKHMLVDSVLESARHALEVGIHMIDEALGRPERREEDE